MYFVYLKERMTVEIPELNHLETTVNDLLSMAKLELEEVRLQQQREQQIEMAIEQIHQRVEPLLEQLQAMWQEYQQAEIEETPGRQKLEEKIAELRGYLENAPLLAAQAVDRQLILNEERLLDRWQAEQLDRWRQSLKADLLATIAEQTDFYSATDTAIAIRGYMEDLKAIGALEEVVEALMAQINYYSQEGPVAKLRGSYEQTLTFIHTKALENRERVERVRCVQPKVRHRTTEKQPHLYTDLKGKVVVFGGHDRLEAAVKKRLRYSEVELYWCSAQSGLQLAEQTSDRIANADLVLIITGYASHALTEKAEQAAQRANKQPEILKTTGMTRVLEAIEYGLKTRLLAHHCFKSA